MKKILLAATAMAMLSGFGAASAADLPTSKGPPVAPLYVPPAFTWTGFYVGVNAGYGWANNSNRNGLPVNAIPIGGFIGSSGGNNGGFVGGGQIGYNYQFGVGQGLVIGAEADLDWASIGHKNSTAPYTFATTPGTTFYPGTGGSSGNYIGTVRARVGYAWDRFLVYGTGGLAYGDIGRRNGSGAYAVTTAGSVNPFNGTIAAANTNTPFLSSGGSSTRAGWTLGAGVEYAVWQNWTVKAEYLYYNLGNGKNNAAISPFFAGNNRHGNSDGNIIRVGVNYKFW